MTPKSSFECQLSQVPPASWADCAFIRDLLGLAVALQPDVTPFLAAQGECTPWGSRSTCAFRHLEDEVKVPNTSQVGTALHHGHWSSVAASSQLRSGQS